MITFSGFPHEILGEERTISEWLRCICREHGKGLGRLMYIFVNNEEILEINRRYLEHDYYTDIITFDYSNKGEISGEVYISVERVGEQAKEFGEDLEREMKRVVAHGLLHLIGFNDKNEEEKRVMRSQEEKALILHAQKFKD